MSTRNLVIGAFGAAAALVGLLVACVGDATDAGGGLTDDGGGGGGGEGGLGTTDGGGGGGGNEGGTGACAPACTDTTTLAACQPDGAAASAPCPYDCTNDGGAHCLAFTADAPVSAADLAETAMLGALTFTATGFVSTDDGSIDGVRTANAGAAHQVISGVGFHVTNKVGIFTAKTVTINVGATMKVRGQNALAIVADTIVLQGVIDARAWGANGTLCVSGAAGPGGFTGGQGGLSGNGPGGGAPGSTIAIGQNGAGGAGGGGYGATGGSGNYVGAGANQFGAEGGASYPLLAPVTGGSGGGSNQIDSVTGGGGGGAVQLVAITSITVGDGTNTGGINVGGCHGSSGSTNGAGAGGGSGGTALLESPKITIAAGGVIAANGGPGGSGPPSGQPVGIDGQLSANPAGGVSSGLGGYGQSGPGGAGLLFPGGYGLYGATKAGPGGGGSVGRIVIRNTSASLSLPGGAVLSPTPPGAPVTYTRILLQ